MRGMFEMNRKIALAGIGNCYLSEITVAELYYGAENSDNPKKTMQQTEDFISLFRVIPFSQSLHTFGRMVISQQRKGQEDYQLRALPYPCLALGNPPSPMERALPSSL